jgi:hypothetical protein
MLVEAACWLVCARLAVLLVPFRFLAPMLGVARGDPPTAEAPSNREVARRVSWAVTTVGRHTPWRSTCLVQAIAAMAMLRRRRLPSVLYLGVGKQDEKNMRAHAWLTSAGITLTGAPVDSGLTVVSVFEDARS